MEFRRDISRRTRRITTLIGVGALVAIAAVPIASAAKPSGGSNPAGNLDQCQNGQVSPLTLTPCLNGTVSGGAAGVVQGSFSDWVNGNVNGQKAHWREGDFLTYRDTLTGLASGTYTLNMHYDTVHGGKHAIDYLGSYDTTEKSQLAATAFNANHNNPCFDKLGATRCPLTAPPTPSDVSGQMPGLPLTSGSSENCNGSSGTFSDNSGSLAAGRVATIFAPTAATVTGTSVSQGTQVTSGSGQCSVPFSVTFTLAGTAPSGGWTVVMAVGGHIAAQTEWGVGNSASAISGSPYHMAQDSLQFNHGSPITIGSQDRALSTSAIFFTPTPATAIYNETTSTANVTTAASGDSVHDTTSFTAGTFATPMSGTVTYHFLDGTGVSASDNTTGCATSITAGATDNTLNTVSVNSDGTVPNSTTKSSLGAGTYAFYAVYSGGGANIGGTSACEPLTISRATPSFTTQQNLLPNDSATFTGLVNPIDGTVDFILYAGSDCSGSVVYQESVDGDGATVITVDANATYDTTNSTVTVSPNADQTYTWQVVYTGDANNTGSTVCEDGSGDPAGPQEQFSIAGS